MGWPLGQYGTHTAGRTGQHNAAGADRGHPQSQGLGAGGRHQGEDWPQQAQRGPASTPASCSLYGTQPSQALATGDLGAPHPSHCKLMDLSLCPIPHSSSLAQHVATCNAQTILRFTRVRNTSSLSTSSISPITCMLRNAVFNCPVYSFCPAPMCVIHGSTLLPTHRIK